MRALHLLSIAALFGMVAGTPQFANGGTRAARNRSFKEAKATLRWLANHQELRDSLRRAESHVYFATNDSAGGAERALYLNPDGLLMYRFSALSHGTKPVSFRRLNLDPRRRGLWGPVWKDKLTPSEIKAKVVAWLDEHPEASANASPSLRRFLGMPALK